jgi:hypothetical protein
MLGMREGGGKAVVQLTVRRAMALRSALERCTQLLRGYDATAHVTCPGHFVI